MRPLNAETPSAPTPGVSKVHVVSRTGILPLLAQLVNRFPPIALYHELLAARSLAHAYEATAIRRDRQRQALCAPKSSEGMNGGQR